MSEFAAPTRTPAFEARLKKRYASERRFKALGLGAILVSVSVLLFLLTTMFINGIGGFQRAELRVPVDFTQAGLSLDPSLTDPVAIQQNLQGQGLPDVIQFFAAKELGEDAAAEVSGDAWREVASAIAEDPGLLRRTETLQLPASSKLAAGPAGRGPPQLCGIAGRGRSGGTPCPPP